MYFVRFLHSLGIQFTPQAFYKYTKNTSWLFLEKVVRMGIVFVVGVWLSRYLGENRFGRISYILSVVGLFSELLSLGTKDILTRDLVSAEPDEERILLGTGFIIHLMGFGFIMLGLMAFVWINDESYTFAQLLFVIGIMFIFRAFQVLEYLFQAKIQAKYIALAQFVMVIISALLKVIGISTQQDIPFFVWIYALEFAIPSLVMIFIYKFNKHHFSDWKFDKARFVSLLSQSKTYILAAVFVSIYVRVDQIMITNMLNDAQNGAYANAVRLTQVWHLVPSVVCASLIPAIVNARQVSEANYEQKFQYLFAILIWFSICLGIGTSLVADPLIAILYAGKFVGTASVLKVHIWSSVFVFLGISSGYYLLQEKLYHLALYRVMMGCFLNIALNYVLIPNYGIIGASVATLFTQGLASYFLHFMFPKTKRLFWLQSRGFFAPILYVFQRIRNHI